MDSVWESWTLLVVSLPTASATARMRIWRNLKAVGCAALRDGAYLLPASAAHDERMQAFADECTLEGGSAWLMRIEPRSIHDKSKYVDLFNRADDYAELRERWLEAGTGVASMPVAELTRLRRKLQREFDALKAIDFFPGEARAAAESAWKVLERRMATVLSPDEPGLASGEISRLDPAAYQGRTWATRRRLWVDRVASAWLIQRFIDPEARFRWLARPADCPTTALGFDFDGAAFTHVGDRVTFQTLMASFGLEHDAALVRLGAMVHALDVGGEPVAEAPGFEAVLAGARERLPDDDALLAEMGAVLDSLYLHFLSGRAPGDTE